MLMELPDFFATNKRSEYEEIFTDMIRHYDTLSQKEEIMIQSLLLKLIYTLNKDISTQYVRKKAETDNIINKTLNYIDNHIEEDLSLEAIAKYNKLSAIHFHNTFKYATGKTLRDYVEQQRIKKAINLLLTTNLNLTGIAFECGFSSQSYFSYVFKRRMKCTPREYVIKINNKYESIET
jgi:transcriptional regulator GlxA family with amidase domain